MAEVEVSRTLKETVRTALEGNSKLRELNRIIKDRKAKYDSEDDQGTGLNFEKLIKNNPEIASLFGAGNDIPVENRLRNGRNHLPIIMKVNYSQLFLN